MLAAYVLKWTTDEQNRLRFLEGDKADDDDDNDNNITVGYISSVFVTTQLLCVFFCVYNNATSVYISSVFITTKLLYVFLPCL